MPITVGDLIMQPQPFATDAQLQFGSGPRRLEFLRLKQRGPNIIQIEFNQNVWRDTDGLSRARRRRLSLTYAL